MTYKLIRITFAFVLVLFVGVSKAQNEYRSEIGVLGGGSFYLGDANNQLFVNNQLSYGLIYRQKLDTRLSITGIWNNTNVVGTGSGVSFDNKINAVDLCGEFNFFDYDDKIYKPNSKKYSLFIFAGIGGMIFPYQSTKPNTFMFSYVGGLGYKFMLGDRFHLNFIWSQRLLLTDKMEGKFQLNNANGLNGSNIFNNDILSTFSVGLTCNIWKKSCDCLKLNR
jgi:hypothetical protein